MLKNNLPGTSKSLNDQSKPPAPTSAFARQVNADESPSVVSIIELAKRQWKKAFERRVGEHREGPIVFIPEMPRDSPKIDWTYHYVFGVYVKDGTKVPVMAAYEIGPDHPEIAESLEEFFKSKGANFDPASGGLICLRNGRIFFDVISQIPPSMMQQEAVLEVAKVLREALPKNEKIISSADYPGVFDKSLIHLVEGLYDAPDSEAKGVYIASSSVEECRRSGNFPPLCFVHVLNEQNEGRFFALNAESPGVLLDLVKDLIGNAELVESGTMRKGYDWIEFETRTAHMNERDPSTESILIQAGWKIGKSEEAPASL